MNKLLFLFLFLISAIIIPPAFAQTNSFVSVVNPVRGNDFWDLADQKPETAVLGQIDILSKSQLSATWLIRFDALDNQVIIDAVKKRTDDEKGLFLEVTPIWATEAGVQYRRSNIWHDAGSAFLTGYERAEREKLINTAFGKFKETFGFYPVSVGAWWIDSYSLSYMQKKYGITGALIVADQYSTDNYQIWGQYFGTPYYPSKNNALHPAQSLENKLDVVMMQWAPRDPVNSYGNGVMESTFSVQANDYIDYHSLDSKYFSSLIDVYTKQQFNQFAQVVVGLENSYLWNKYGDEYGKQMAVLEEKRNSDGLQAVSMKGFAVWYRQSFPRLSPEQLIIADDPLGSVKKTVWLMNTYYRVGWFFNNDGSVFRDIRQYIDGEEELCFKMRCNSVNFATSATRVLDEVSFGHKWIIDQGKISDFKVERKGEDFVVSYKNEAGNLRQIGLLPRDLSIDGKVLSIDTAILTTTKNDSTVSKKSAISNTSLKWSFFSVGLKILEFLIFLILAIIVPGFVLINKTLKKEAPIFLKIFLSIALGIVMLTLLFYLTSLLKIRFIVYIYIFISLIFFLRFKLYNNLSFSFPKIRGSVNLILGSIILAGTIFQVIPTFRSGLTFGYGMGFWGPNTHDGVWHLALINQLIKSVPPENPVYSGIILKNYHFFYDLFVAATSNLSGIPITDLIFRFFPILFSLMLGIGSYYLIMKLFKSKISSFFSLYLIYFAGSFGWIVEFLRERHFGGESAFWANQAVSFNLNPPFAISLVIIIALLHILFNLSNSGRFRNISLAILLAGSLIGFKSYGAILVLAALLITGLLKRNWSYLIIFAGAILVSLLIFLPNFDVTSTLLVFAPFWFVHSMMDSPDRVGWLRITLMREAGFEKSNWFKIFLSETLSLAIFIAGNLGLRVISLFSLGKIKNIIIDQKLFFIFIFALLSFLTPILLVQAGNPWNTIQFSYYGLYIAALASGPVFQVVTKLPKYIAALVILIVIFMAPINSAVTANSYLSNNPHAFISTKELEGLTFLSGQPDGVVLTFPYDGKLKLRFSEPRPLIAYDSTAYVAAISGKSIFVEDEPQNQILLTDYKKRLITSNDFFLKPIGENMRFLQDNKIRYIYLPKIYNSRLDDADIVRNIFENQDVIIYKVQQ